MVLAARHRPSRLWMQNLDLFRWVLTSIFFLLRPLDILTRPIVTPEYYAGAPADDPGHWPPAPHAFDPGILVDAVLDFGDGLAALAFIFICRHCLSSG
jgi:hypothetical protein